MRSSLWQNALHDRVKAFLQLFYGVSSKWLRHYLWWFRYADQVTCHYELTRRAAIDAPQPFWDFWEGTVPEGA